MAQTIPVPKMSVEDAHKILTAPGAPFELVDMVIDGEKYKAFKNQPPTLRAVWEITQAHAAREYIVYLNERYTFEQAHFHVATLAHLLINKYGVQKGDRVAILMRNMPEWIFTWWASLCIGAICVPLNSWLTGEELEYIISDSGTKVLLADTERIERIAPYFQKLKSTVQSIIVVRAQESFFAKHKNPYFHLDNWKTVMEQAPATGLPTVEVSPVDNATLMYTSGTTGKPKGALCHHFSQTSMTMLVMSSRTALRYGHPLPQPNPAQLSLLVAVPLFHATGSLSILVPGTIAGGKLSLMFKWEPSTALQLVEREKVNIFVGVPAMLWQMVEFPDFKKYDTSSLASVNSGGAPSSPELVMTVKNSFPQGSPGQGWGMTETSAFGANNGLEDYLRKPDSIGPCNPTGEIKIIDTQTLKELPVGSVGEIIIRGPFVMREYWNKPDANKAAFIYPGKWLRTGDVGKIDEEGFVYILDRAKDMIIRGGENIYNREIEDCLYSHHTIMDAAVVGIPHKVLGEEVAAVVQVKPEYVGKVTEADLQSYVRSKLAGFKVPVVIEFRNEPLPRNGPGKIMKNILRKDMLKYAEARKAKL